jgi:hypothetical protein
MLPVETPFKTYTGRDGKPLDGGCIYFGQSGLNPITAPVTVYWDAAGTQPAVQPLRTINGYIVNKAGMPANVFFDGSYSELVQDSKGRQVFYAPTSDNFSIGTLVSNLFKSSGATLIGFIVNIVGAVKQTVADVLSDMVSLKSFGMVGDGVTGNGAAFATMLSGLGANTYEVLVPRGDWLIDTNETIPTNVKLRFRAGGRLLIPNGVTLTLNNVELLAGRQQIFVCTGSGKVAGAIRNDLIFPEWWGAIADGLHPNVGTDFSDRAAAAARNGPPLQAALTFAGNQYSFNGNTGTVSLTYGFYVYNTTLSVPLSTNVIGYGIGSALFFYSPTGNAVECVPPIGGNNTMLKDFFIAPIAGPTWNVSTGYGLYMKNVSTPIVDNVWSSGFGPGGAGGGTFYFENIIEGRIRGLISDNSNGPAYTIRGVSQGTVLSNCINAGTKYGAAFDIQSGYDLTLVACTGKGGGTGFTNGFYVNAWEDLNMVSCSTFRVNREGIVTTASVLNSNIVNLTVNDASSDSPGTYAGMSISGSRITLTAPKVTSNTPQYNYGIQMLGAATDCTISNPNVTPGTLGSILDGQPIGSNTFPVRKVTTTDATVTTIWTRNMNNSAGARIEATVVGKQRGDTGVTAMFKLSAYVRTNSTGTAFLNGPTAIESYKSDASLNATFVLSSSSANANVLLQVTGLATGNPMDWEATVTTISVTG